MKRAASRLAALILAAACIVAGITGAVGYAQDYSLHRGFSTLVQFRRAGTGRLQEIHFYSRALHRSADYLVYLPPGYHPGRRYPVYYLLHGMPGKPMVFVDIANMDIRLDNQMSLGRARSMILVYPDGRINNNTFSDSEWANTPSGNFQSYVIEVMHNVDHHFSTLRRRQDRVIAGFSAGAYGAINIALHHLSEFASVQSWSGYYTQTRTGVFAHASARTLADNSPLQEVDRLGPALRRYPLRVDMFIGRDDSSAPQQAPMAARLAAHGVQVTTAVYPGGHDWSVWYPRLNAMLDLASRDFARVPARHSTVRGERIAGGPSAQPRPVVSQVPPVRHHRPARRRRRHSELRLIGALLLALICAALINIGFVLQQRGHERADRRGRPGLSGAVSDPVWLAGQATGWAGFAGQIIAVALAPLTLVQAFSAGGLALSVPLAARLFGHRVTGRQLTAIALIALSLASLPLGYGPHAGRLAPGILIAIVLAVLLVGGSLSPRRGAGVMALAAGILYGSADGAIKAASIALRGHGGPLIGWVLLAALGTLGGFLAFQEALRDREPVRSLSLMNALTALTAIAIGMAAFGERLGASPLATGVHIVAIVTVLICVRPLAGAHSRAASPDAASAEPAQLPLHGGSRGRVSRGGTAGWGGTAGSWAAPLRALAGASAGLVAVLSAVIVMIGLLYQLRQHHLLGAGPGISDSLPLLQLAGFAAQPAGRVLVTAVGAGLILGLGMIRVSRWRRIVLVGVLAQFVLLVSSDAAFALTRNLRLTQVLLHRSPGTGPWVQAIILSLAAALPGGGIPQRLPAILRRVSGRRTELLSVVGAIAIIALVGPALESGPAQARPSQERPGFPALHSGHRPGTRDVPPRPARPAYVRIPLSASGSQTLDRSLDSLIRIDQRQSGAPALTAAVVRCGRVIWAGAGGVLSLSQPRRATAGSLFVLNSAVKTIIATMIMQEVDAGRLSLSTRLASFFPEIADARRITVSMLLNMTSGVPDYLDGSRIQWLIAHRPRYHWTLAALLRGLGGPAFAPGSRYRYSDTNYILLGAILTRITHRPIQATFDALLGRRLRLGSATFLRSAAAEARVAHPYFLTRKGVRHSLWVPGFGISTATWGPVFTDGGMVASVPDLARFANALFAGRLITAPALARMTHIGRGHYGFGLQRRVFDGQQWLGHVGAFGGYEAQDWTIPARELTVAVAADASRDGGGLISNPLWHGIVRSVDRSPALAGGCPVAAGSPRPAPPI